MDKLNANDNNSSSCVLEIALIEACESGVCQSSKIYELPCFPWKTTYFKGKEDMIFNIDVTLWDENYNVFGCFILSICACFLLVYCNNIQ